MNENKFILIISGIIAGCIQAGIIIGMLILPNVVFNNKVNNLFIDNSIKQQYSANEANKSSINKIVKKLQSGESGSPKEIVFYNGTTIDEGIKSSEEIDRKAIELTKKATTDREKAKILYTWIGSNIKYDDDKAKEVLSENDIKKMPESGARAAFENRSGICFDKACLYVAMSRAINLKVRLLGGQAFNGKEYVSHAWNQVYLNDEGKWINVDSTFYTGGNYFDSNLFEKHKVEEIAGEW